MPDRILTERIRADILNNGMDLVGFAPVDRWKYAPYLLSPQAILPESKTVIVAAIHITDTWTEMGGEPTPQDLGPGGWIDQNSHMDRIAYRVVRMLNDSGEKAIAVASSNIWRYRAFEGIPSLFAPDLSHIHAAVAAGLGEIGWCSLAITPEFGPRVRFISIVTSAELTPTPMYDGPKLCDMCMECVKHCPTAALTKELGKPREVTIGDKTYRYANKNIWRCAWAEHFNLDLQSENLKKLEHVSEKEILEELSSHGIRGHERGVCQKVCIPPHLRSDAKSFGRDRKITLNRINRRYPDNMPTLRKMRDDIRAYAVGMGAEIVEVGPITPDTPAFKQVNTEAPGMRTVIAFALRIPKETHEAKTYDPDVSSAYEWAINLETHHIALRVARMVEDYGYHAASYSGGILNSDLVKSLARMAGIGKIDADGTFNTSELGENVALGAVTTDAPLDATPDAENCDGVSTRRAISGNALRADLELIAFNNLVSGFGVAPVERFDTIVNDLKANIDENLMRESVIDGAKLTYHGVYEPKFVDTHARIRGPRDYMPAAKSIVVLSMHFPGELIENAGLEDSRQIGTYGFHQYQTAYELRFAAIKVVRELQAQGYATLISENMLGIGSLVNTPRSLLPDARCNAIEAVAAGLGQIGRHGALLTAEHGAHQRQIVIITDANLPANDIYSGEALCKQCGACRKHCPMTAIDDKFFDLYIGDQVISYPLIPRHRCDWSKRYALCSKEGPALIGSTTDVVPPSGEITISDIADACAQKDPVMKSRTCILESCLRHCPAGLAADNITNE